MEISLKSLSMSWGEIVFLLKQPNIESETAYSKTKQNVSDGLSFLERVNELAESLDRRKGEICQSFLPFNENTSA